MKWYIKSNNSLCLEKFLMIAEVIATQWVAAVCLAKKSGPVPGPIWSPARPGSKAFALTAFCIQTLQTRDQRARVSSLTGVTASCL